MNIVDWSLDNAQVFTLVLFRMLGLFLLAPFYGSRNIPPQVRIGFALLASFLVFGGLPEKATLPESLPILGVAAATEMAIGLILGLAASLLFVGVQYGGYLVGQQMGITLANVIDPLTSEQVSIVAQIKFYLFLVVFLAVDGHHFLLGALVETYQVVPLVGFRFDPALGNMVVRDLGAEMFVIALKISAPAMVGLLLATVAMGFMARMVPEMNLFIVGFSIRIAVGLGILAVSIASLIYVMEGLNLDLARYLRELVRLMG